MSAFIVSNRTMSRAIVALRYAGVADRFGCASDNRLGDLLFDLNARAVADRYGDGGEAVEYRPEPGLAVDKADALKGLVCLLYQCAEGRIPETAPYRLLEEAERLLSGAIVAELPEYRAAPWDSPSVLQPVGWIAD
jgi:hypothetical protein